MLLIIAALIRFHFNKMREGQTHSIEDYLEKDSNNYSPCRYNIHRYPLHIWKHSTNYLPTFRYKRGKHGNNTFRVLN